MERKTPHDFAARRALPEADQPRPAKPLVQRREPKRRVQATRPNFTTQRGNVRLVGTELRGIMLVRGPQQSEVKWLNGNVNIVVNEWIEDIK
jgi:hypothetical protein